MNILDVAQAKEMGNGITGTFPMNGVDASVLFDSGASHSFVSSSFMKKLGLDPEHLSDFLVTLPSQERVRCTGLYTDLQIIIRDERFPIDPIEFKDLGFDVISGMDWLQRYRGRIHCAEHRCYSEAPVAGRFPIAVFRMSPQLS